MSQLRIAFAGDRDIGVRILEFILSQGVHPIALLLPEKSKASHSDEMRMLCGDLAEDGIIVGTCFREQAGIEKLRSLKLDYILGVHFPYLVPESVLTVSGRGFLNLHPAYLPFNRGWHTPTWAILEGTPVGATLHFMDAGLDTGDIVHQRELQISVADNANTLYQKIKELEFDVFQEAWPELVSSRVSKFPQNPSAGSFHKRGDLFQEQVQKIDLDETTTPRQFITKLRALTTDRIKEAAYFEIDGRRYRVQIAISSEEAETTIPRAVLAESVPTSVTAVDVRVEFPSQTPR